MPACGTCGGFATTQPGGRLIPHQRYADGAGYGPDQSHELVPCEGGIPDPADAETAVKAQLTEEN